MKKLFAYIRVSTVKQGERGSSLQEQKSAIEAYAARHGLIIAEWFEERETAAKLGRRMFSRMLSALEHGKADGVVIHKIDRSARNLRDWANLGGLIDRGVEVHFAHESLDLNSRGGRLSADIQAVVAADFIRNLREETRKGFYGRLKQGLYPIRAPYGYRDCGGGRAKEIDPIQGPIVKAAFQLYASGDWTFDELRAELYRRGLRRPTGGPVTKNALTTILNNPFYIGLIHLRKTNEIFQGIHKPLITKGLYDQVQYVLCGGRVGKVLKHDYLFRRLIRCANCDCYLTGERHKGRYVYYRCHTQGCQVSIPERAVDELLRSVLSPLRFDPGELRDLRDLVQDTKAELAEEAKQREAAVRLQLAQCEKRLARLTDALLDGLIGKDVFEERRKLILMTRAGLNDRLANPSSAGAAADQLLDYLELANTAYLSYENGFPAEKRDLVESMSSNFTGTANKPAITLKSPFQELAKWHESHDCDPYRDRVRTFMKKIVDMLKRHVIEHPGEELPKLPVRRRKPNPSWANIEKINRIKYAEKPKKELEELRAESERRWGRVKS
jgi:site-specific DNA recombinase